MHAYVDLGSAVCSRDVGPAYVDWGSAVCSRDVVHAGDDMELSAYVDWGSVVCSRDVVHARDVTLDTVQLAVYTVTDLLIFHHAIILLSKLISLLYTNIQDTCFDLNFSGHSDNFVGGISETSLYSLLAI